MKVIAVTIFPQLWVYANLANGDPGSNTNERKETLIRGAISDRQQRLAKHNQSLAFFEYYFND